MATLKNTTGKKRVSAGYGIDIDAVAGWLESYGGEDSVSDISRGIQSSLLIDKLLHLLTASNEVSRPATLKLHDYSSYSTNTTSKNSGSS